MYLSDSFFECRNCLLISWLRMDTGLSNCNTQNKFKYNCVAVRRIEMVHSMRVKELQDRRNKSTWTLKWSKMAVSSSFLLEIRRPETQER